MESIARLSLEKSFKFQKKLSSGGFPGTAWQTDIFDDWPHYALDLLRWRPYHIITAMPGIEVIRGLSSFVDLDMNIQVGDLTHRTTDS